MAARRLEEDRSDSEARAEKGKGAVDATGWRGIECTDMQMRGGRPRVTNF